MSIDYHLKELAKEIENERAAHKIAIERLQAAAGMRKLHSNWQPVKFPSIRVNAVSTSGWAPQLRLQVSRFCNYNDQIEHNYPMTDEGLAQAIAKVKELHEVDREAHKANLEAVTENRKILASFGDMLKSIGIVQTVKVYNSKKRVHEETAPNPVFNQLYDSAPAYAAVGIDIDRRILELTNNLTEMLQVEKRKAAKKLEEERVRKLADPLLGEAVKYLAARGKEAGVDYSLENAVEVANEIAFHDEVKRILQDEGDMHQFDGNDECTDCGGWDGSSPRCECGTYRVSWARGYGHSFKTPCVIAEIH